MLLAETYRLNIALRLHAIQMVRLLPWPCFERKPAVVFVCDSLASMIRIYYHHLTHVLPCTGISCHQRIAGCSLHLDVPNMPLTVSSVCDAKLFCIYMAKFSPTCCGLGYVQVCFVFQEVDLFLQSSRSHPRSPWDAGKDLVIALLLGKAVPIALNVLVEAHSRAAFLRKRCSFCTAPCIHITALLLSLTLACLVSLPLLFRGEIQLYCLQA